MNSRVLGCGSKFEATVRSFTVLTTVLSPKSIISHHYSFYIISVFHLTKSTHRQVFNYSFFIGPSFIRSWKFGMFSDSESTGGSSESRSLDSESISPGIYIFKSN